MIDCMHRNPLYSKPASEVTPPIPEATSCVNVSHRMVDIPKVVALTPLNAQGDTEDSSKPVPNIKRISDKAAVAQLPPR